MKQMVRLAWILVGLALGLVQAPAQIIVSNTSYPQFIHSYAPADAPFPAESADVMSSDGEFGPAYDLEFGNMTVGLVDNGSGTIQATLNAPTGMMFQILPSGIAGDTQTLTFGVDYGTGSFRPAHLFSGFGVSFGNLTGSYGTVTDDNSVFNSQKAVLEFDLAVTGPLTFTSVTYTAHYDPTVMNGDAGLSHAGLLFDFAEFQYIETYTTGSSTSDPDARLTLQPLAASAPEPSTVALLLGGMIGLSAWRRRYRA